MWIIRTKAAFVATAALLVFLFVVAVLGDSALSRDIGLLLVTFTGIAALAAFWEARRLAVRQADMAAGVARGGKVSARKTRQQVARAVRAGRDRDGANSARFEWLVRQLEAHEDRTSERFTGLEKFEASLTEDVALLSRDMDKLGEYLRDVQQKLEAIQSGDHSQSLRKRLVADIHSLLILQDAKSMPVIEGWAMAPRVLDSVLRAMRASEERDLHVVECGSGVSTSWIARELRARGGGRVTALEHDQHYADVTRRQLREAGLTDLADVRYAPLQSVEVEGQSFDWYSEYSDLAEIDVLVVDGPPSATGPEARLPAVPLLISKLKPGAVVVLDDASRADERSVVERWTQSEYGSNRLTVIEETDRAVVMQVMPRGGTDESARIG